MRKFVLVNCNDGNNRVELKAHSLKKAYEEALDKLGWNVLHFTRQKVFKPYNKKHRRA